MTITLCRSIIIYREGGEQVEYLLKSLAVITSLVTIRHLWYAGTNAKLDRNKKQRDEIKRRRGG